MGESTRFSRALDDPKAVALTGKIMVVAIIVLFVVVVFVIFLHLYAKWFWRRLGGGEEEEDEDGADSAPSRNRRRRRFVFASGQDPAAAIHRGLDSSVLRCLPALVFSGKDFRDGLECAVCLSELADGERARLLPKCNHGFHVDCIDMWFQSHSTCPLCRNSVAPEKKNSVDDPQIGVDSAAAAEESEIDIPSFPTNVLVWGDQSQVSSWNACLEEGGGSANVLPSPSPSPSSSNDGVVVVIDVPSENPVASSSASVEELKSPVTTRLRSLKRLLSREKRVIPCSSNSVSNIEQGNKAQS